MKFLPKNLCKKLIVVNGIGICNLKRCICKCWNCESKFDCGAKAFESCPLKTGMFNEIPNTVSLYKAAMKTADKEIERLLVSEDNVKIKGGLLFRRESEILHAFYEAPGDLPYAVSTANQYMTNLVGIKKADVKYTEEANKLWNLIVTKEVFADQIARIINKDIICFGNSKGYEELKSLVNDPLQDINKLNKYIETKSEPTIESQNVGLYFSDSMSSVIEWCKANINQVDLLDYTLHDNFKKIEEHVIEVGTTGEVSPSLCYKLAFPHYEGMLHACKYIYSKFNHIKTLAVLNKGIDKALEEKHSITFNVAKSYDNFLLDLSMINRKGNFRMSGKIGKQIEDYQFIIEGTTLFGSALLLGFMSANYNSVCLEPFKRGFLFEDNVKNELQKRNVRILHQNLKRNTIGEIDFICTKNNEFFMVEAKDYAPWFDFSYVGSKTYDERIKSINEKCGKASERLQWIEKNRTELGIPISCKIKGIIITRFIEPHISIPTGFNLVAISEINSLFGEPMNKQIHETGLKFKFDIPALKERMIKEEIDTTINLSKYSLS